MPNTSFWSDKKDKEWWSNFWFYYKYKLLFGGLFILLMAVGIAQCATNIIPDLTVTYAGTQSIDDELYDKITGLFSAYIDDIDGKGGRYVELLRMNPMLTMELMTELEAGESYLFILDERAFNGYAGQGRFVDISDITGGGAPVYGIPLKGNQKLAGTGLNVRVNLYAAVRIITDSRKDMRSEPEKQQNALKVISFLYE